ncbi:hypothetical protein BC830DRAFT_771943 [Chytriomyces sp. MP71]|nr:hypothetical protein BC830DRAFT_771943 [Chytriomyces sp. MP71]
MLWVNAHKAACTSSILSGPSIVRLLIRHRTFGTWMSFQASLPPSRFPDGIHISRIQIPSVQSLPAAQRCMLRHPREPPCTPFLLNTFCDLVYICSCSCDKQALHDGKQTGARCFKRWTSGSCIKTFFNANNLSFRLLLLPKRIAHYLKLLLKY